MLASTSQEEPNLSRDAVSSSRTWPCSKQLGQCITIRALRLALGEMIGSCWCDSLHPTTHVALLPVMQHALGSGRSAQRAADSSVSTASDNKQPQGLQMIKTPIIAGGLARPSLAPWLVVLRYN